MAAHGKQWKENRHSWESLENESKNWMLPGVGWLLRKRRHNKRKRDERGWEWRKMSRWVEKCSTRVCLVWDWRQRSESRAIYAGFEATQWKSSYICWIRGNAVKVELYMLSEPGWKMAGSGKIQGLPGNRWLNKTTFESMSENDEKWKKCGLKW